MADAGQPDLRVEYVPTEDLVPYAGNAKEHPEWQVGEISESIKQFGFSDPIGAWHDPQGRALIVEGHGRLLAAEELGMETVPVMWLDHLDDDGRRAYGLAHNQLTMNTGWDDAALQAELDALEDIDLGTIGLDDLRTEPLESVDGVAEDVPPEPEEGETVTQPGDVWLLGDHRLMCADSADEQAMDELCHGEEADMMLTDPPYNVDVASSNEVRSPNQTGIENDAWADEGAFQEFLESTLGNARRPLRAGGAFYVWHASMHTPTFRAACEAIGLQTREVLVWVKNTFAIGRQDYQWRHELCLYGWKDGAAHWFAPTRGESTAYEDVPDYRHMDKEQLRRLAASLLEPDEETTVLHYGKPTASALHPTMKPVRLFARQIRNSSRPGEIVLDPFGGSGTTLIVCEQMGRKARLVELDPHYCDVIVRRWERLTGRKAEQA